MDRTFVACKPDAVERGLIGEIISRFERRNLRIVRAELPEISPGSNVGLIVRQFVSVAGESSRSNINKLGLEPFLNIGLPKQWFLNSSPKMTYDLYSKEWFVPLDLMVGKKFGRRWVASLEYQYGLVGSSANYKYWLEARVGHFF